MESSSSQDGRGEEEQRSLIHELLTAENPCEWSTDNKKRVLEYLQSGRHSRESRQEAMLRADAEVAKKTKLPMWFGQRNQMNQLTDATLRTCALAVDKHVCGGLLLQPRRGNNNNNNNNNNKNAPAVMRFKVLNYFSEIQAHFTVKIKVNESSNNGEGDDDAGLRKECIGMLTVMQLRNPTVVALRSAFVDNVPRVIDGILTCWTRLFLLHMLLHECLHGLAAAYCTPDHVKLNLQHHGHFSLWNRLIRGTKDGDHQWAEKETAAPCAPFMRQVYDDMAAPTAAVSASATATPIVRRRVSPKSIITPPPPPSSSRYCKLLRENRRLGVMPFPLPGKESNSVCSFCHTYYYPSSSSSETLSSSPSPSPSPSPPPPPRPRAVRKRKRSAEGRNK